MVRILPMTAIVVLAGFLAGCSGGGRCDSIHIDGLARDEKATNREIVVDILSKQQDAWNRGDIEGFMEGYWRSSDLTFSSGGVVQRGWHATRDRYLSRYPNRAAMGRLRFSDLEVIPIAPGSLLVLGRWHLEREEPIGGAFSLVFAQKEGSWVIVHDHTSVDAES